MAFEVHDLEGRPEFGAIVTHLAIGDLEDPLVRENLHKLWIDRGVIVFRGFPASDESHVQLSNVFGKPDRHPNHRGLDKDGSLVTDIRYKPEEGQLYEVDGVALGAWLPWHSDLCYVDKINRGGILRPLRLPERGGATGFIDQVTAYRRLPDALKQRIGKLNVLYKLNLDSSQAKFGRPASLRCLRLGDQIKKVMTMASDRARAIHPMVYVQKETGRPVLNVSPWFADAVEGMETPEGEALLHEVVRLGVTAEQAYFHQWRPEDMVLWDNWRMLHCATGIPPTDSRAMQRTTIAGDYALGRLEVNGPKVGDGLVFSV